MVESSQSNKNVDKPMMLSSQLSSTKPGVKKLKNDNIQGKMYVLCKVECLKIAQSIFMLWGFNTKKTSSGVKTRPRRGSNIQSIAGVVKTSGGVNPGSKSSPAVKCNSLNCKELTSFSQVCVLLNRTACVKRTEEMMHPIFDCNLTVVHQG